MDRYRIICFFIIFCQLSLLGCAQKPLTNSIAIAFYNCENFFDTIHNPARGDEEFTPTGEYHYTAKIYEQKAHNIATVLQSMGGPEGPAIIGLAEVENSTVLNDLISQPEISRRHYRYEWFDGPDLRGINVAMLYNPAYFRVLNAEPIHILYNDSGLSVIRDILYVHGILYSDTIDVFINHWPSHRGGEEESSPKRDFAAKANKDAVAKLMKKNENSKIIMMGDFNDNPADNSIANILGAKTNQIEVAAGDLYNPWASIYNSGAGTEVFRHRWNLFDQIIISGALLQNKNYKLCYDKVAIFKPDFITDHHKEHEGAPYRSFAGTHWIKGYSDHFPVVLFLKK